MEPHISRLSAQPLRQLESEAPTLQAQSRWNRARQPACFASDEQRDLRVDSTPLAAGGRKGLRASRPQVREAVPRLAPASREASPVRCVPAVGQAWEAEGAVSGRPLDEPKTRARRRLRRVRRL